MKEMTKENLKEAFAGESQAHMKYLAFSARAERTASPTSPACSRPLPMPSRSTPSII